MREIPRHRVRASRTKPWKPDLNFEKFFDEDFLRSRGFEDFKKNLQWPSKDDVSILQSLRFHAGQREKVRVGLKEPTKRELKRVLAVLEECFGVRKPENQRELTVPVFFECLRDVDMKSSPGWPWKNWYKTNGEMLIDQETGDLNIPNAMELYEQVEKRLEDLKHGVVSDDINVFVKGELHKKTKVETGAFRLISSVSITDSMVDRILFGNFFDRCYDFEGFSQTPNKAGWTPYLGGYRWMTRRHRRGKTLFADKKSWDWTMQGWVAYVLTELMLRLCAFTEERRRQIANRMMSLFCCPTFNVGGWLRFSQALAGLMKSGCLGTIVWNGIAQVALHVLAEIRRVGFVDPDGLPDTIGDDTVQRAMEDLERYIAELNAAGCIARDYHVSSVAEGGKIDFAGHLFDMFESIPAYGQKHMGCLYESSDFKLEQLESYARLYTFDPEVYRRVNRWISHLGGRTFSREYMIDWYNGELEETCVYN